MVCNVKQGDELGDSRNSPGYQYKPDLGQWNRNGEKGVHLENTLVAE